MTRRLVQQLHLWVGLLLCLPLAVLGLSGSLLVYEDWSRVFDPHRVAASGEEKPIGDIIAAARATAPEGYSPAFYRAPEGPGDFASVRLVARPQRQEPGGSAAPSQAAGVPLRVEVDPMSLQGWGNLPSSRIIAFVHTLHANFFLSDRRLVGWFGVAMVVLGISGIVNWWPPRRRWREGFFVRGNARGAALYRQLHGATGIWAYAVFIVVSLSGVYLAFPQTVRGAVDIVAPARDLRAAAASVKVGRVAGAAAMPVDDAVALARHSVAEARVDFVGLPSRPDQPYRITLLRPGQRRGQPAVTVFVDPWTGQIVKTVDPRDYSAGETLIAWQHLLHSGEGAGPVWKLLVFLVGFVPSLFALTGVSMWWLKRVQRLAAAARTAAAASSPTAGRAAE
ncbi:MAG TPA: PepSY-associated TM helix domain-containing protein [Stellaceae bacterium]|nr:PepSY-associated TM helix domain-containing protein [Stellaceae bacterium]